MDGLDSAALILIDKGKIFNECDREQSIEMINISCDLFRAAKSQTSIKADIGKIMIVLISMAERNGLSAKDCLEFALGGMDE